MNKRSLTVSILLLAVESLIVSADLYSAISRGGISNRVPVIINSLILLIFLIFVFTLLLTVVDKRMQSRLYGWFELALENRKFLKWTVIFAGLALYESIQDVLFLAGNIPGIHYQEYKIILANHFSILIFAALASLQLLILIFTSHADIVWGVIKKNLQGSWAVLFTVIFGIVLIINFSGFGMRFDSQSDRFFQTTNAPVPGIQVLFLVAAYLGVLAGVKYLSSKNDILNRIFKKDFLIILAVWLLAFSIWSSTPTSANYFVDRGRPPNNSLSPASDALYFDIQAQRILAGEGFDEDFYPRHPMYILFLAFSHLLTGKGYLDVIYFQIALLSLTPVLLYKLVRLLHNRSSGLLVALLFILRERNSLYLSQHITVTNVKTLMTEPLTIFCIILLVYLLALWLKEPGKNLHLAMLLGGVLGFAVLLRVEALMFIPIFGLLSFFYLWRKKRSWLRGMIVMFAACGVMVFPWMYRNKVVLGSYAIDYHFQYQNKLKDLFKYFYPGKTRSDDSDSGDRSSSYYFPAIKPAKQSSIPLLPYKMLKQPEESSTELEHFLDHFFNNITQGLYYLPSNHQPLLTIGSLPDFISSTQTQTDIEEDSPPERYLERYIKSLPYWDYHWNGKLQSRSFLPVAFTIGIIALGISGIKRSGKWIAVLLLLLFVFYGAAFALLGYSGGRFIFLVDWITLLFYGIGLSIVVSKIRQDAGGWLTGSGERGSDPLLEKEQEISLSGRPGILVLGALLILFTGGSMYAVDQWLPSPYTPSGLQENTVEVPGFSEAEQQIMFALSNAGFQPLTLFGRALYPKFFKNDEGLADNRKATLPDRSYKRVEFYLIGMENGWVVLPGKEGLGFFPHGVDVIVIGSRQPAEFDQDGNKVHGDYIMAERVYLLSDSHQLNPVVLSCSSPVCKTSPEE